MYTHYVGIDVSKKTLDVVKLHDEQAQHRVFQNNIKGWRQIKTWITTINVSTHVCLEATGCYSEGIALYLFQAGLNVSVVNPARIHAYGQSRLKRQKTDKADALLIAQFCQTQSPSLWSPPDPAFAEQKIMVRYRAQLQKMLQQEWNRLGHLPPDIPLRDLVQQHIDFLQEELNRLWQQIQTCIRQHPQLQQIHHLLQSIDGIGALTAVILMAEIGDIHRFAKANQLAAYAGLTPQHRRSGTSVRGHTQISKRGNKHLRKALYFPAMVAIRCNPILILFANRLLQNGQPPQSVIVAVMRKLLHLAFGVWRSQMPFDPHFNHNQQIAA